jgi:hypothetical protein
VRMGGVDTAIDERNTDARAGTAAQRFRIELR